ncbi:methyl-accepting chemotaxis protein [Sphingomonas sp. PP-F2F-G114-C0414]|uniref:methyl-accepting chemotaxis protein n=2 Tax=unclassified Sphingomonas TaxID=196159 RepID=UPI000EF93207|nr:methyl-accepting chemotaxis protein [Sphingomonas sp. PP-F2F-G114-C0414]RMB34158.1 methyl-accepting chemotaxis protein [Sphingomonas sp. PP-F2F-G114-C0414]
MKFLDNIKIPTKIVALLLMLGAITMFIAWNGSRRILIADNANTEMTEDMANTVQLVRATRMAVQMSNAAFATVVYDGASPEARDAAQSELSNYNAARDLFGAVEKQEPALKSQLGSFIAQLDQSHVLTSRAAALGLQNRNAEATAVIGQARPLIAKLSADLVAFNDARIAAANKSADELTIVANSTSTTMIVMGIIGVVAGVGLALIVTRSGITGPLAKLQSRMGEIAAGDYTQDVTGTDRGDEIGAMAKAVKVFRENGIAKDAADAAKARADGEQKMVVDTVSTHLSELSAGDLTAAIKADFPPEYGALKSNFNEALDNLRGLISSVSESALTIRTGSGEIAQASEDLARRTESNAASLEETAASVTQMDGRLKASASASTKTVERADQAIATVGGGRAVADEAVQAMGRVSESAKGIDSVIEGLDKIAFQTRVLAMNAAVEAGRAGDAGRGFAVVADLVSALAMRAEEEAKRARDQLTVTQTDIVTAVEAVQKVDGALANISGDVGQVHELLATMAADNQAQSAAITQISAAIGTMDQSTQQNAAMVEETSAAARNLASEVGNLADQASRFNVGNGGGNSGARAKIQQTFGKALSQPSAGYASPVKPLPAAAIPALVRSDDDWNEF